jgi:hypothetical protein
VMPSHRTRPRGPRPPRARETFRASTSCTSSLRIRESLAGHCTRYDGAE